MNPSPYAWSRLSFAFRQLENDHDFQARYPKHGLRVITHYHAGLSVRHTVGETWPTCIEGSFVK